MQLALASAFHLAVVGGVDGTVPKGVVPKRHGLLESGTASSSMADKQHEVSASEVPGKESRACLIAKRDSPGGEATEA